GGRRAAAPGRRARLGRAARPGRPTGARRAPGPAAAGALVDVAAVPPWLSLRARADGRCLRPRPGRGVARRAARGLVHAARGGPDPAQARAALVRGRGTGGLRGGDPAAGGRVGPDPPPPPPPG